MTDVKDWADVGFVDRLSDQIEVVEAWHLPSGPGASDGRHIIAIDQATLLDEPWESDKFPFCFVRWSPEPRGFYGVGLAEELLGIHLDVNTTIDKIERALELVATPQIWIEQGSRVKPTHMTDIPGAINTYSGTPPIYMAPPAVSPETYNYLNSQIQRGLQVARLSAQSMSGKIPSGLETGAAVREFHDIESESFSLVSKNYETFFMDIYDRLVPETEEVEK